MSKRRFEPTKYIPLISFVVIFLIFFIASGGKNITPFNLGAILDQSIVVIIGGLGTIFVVALGSVDMTIGITMALSGIVSSIIVEQTKIEWMIVPSALIVGATMGLFVGIIVSKFRVPSFMTTLAILIGMRGVINYIQTHSGLHYFPSSLRWMNYFGVRAAIVIILATLMIYVLEYTKTGKYCKAIGENETAAQYVGVPVSKIRIISYVLSGLTASIASLFTMANVGGTSTTMGVFYELQVMIAVFLGGVLVTGGTSASIYKLLIGAFTITIIENGLILCGYSSSETSEAVKGVLLMIILFFTIYFNDDSRKKVRFQDQNTIQGGKNQ
ncbi:MAG: ABC transporter permease [Saccharofermentanales bacterium]|jgi:ribose transport system permease protein